MHASTALPHLHVWGSHALHPSLWATATLISSSVSRSPTVVMGGAASQLPECGDDAANSLYYYYYYYYYYQYYNGLGCFY